jgi:hypothetical protein
MSREKKEEVREECWGDMWVGTLGNWKGRERERERERE